MPQLSEQTITSVRSSPSCDGMITTSSSFQAFDVIIIPDMIDLNRFKDALSQVLSLFPTFCGRLRHDTQKGVWSVCSFELSPSTPTCADRTCFHMDSSHWVIPPSRSTSITAQNLTKQPRLAYSNPTPTRVIVTELIRTGSS